MQKPPRHIRDPAELGVKVWLRAFGDRNDLRTTRQLIVESITQAREAVRADAVTGQIRRQLAITLPHNGRMNLRLMQTDKTPAPPQALQSPYWLLTADASSFAGADTLPAFAHKAPVRKIRDAVPARGVRWLLGGVIRRWRNPREQDLAFWLDEVGMRRNIREQRATGLELAVPLRFVPPSWAAVYLTEPAIRATGGAPRWPWFTPQRAPGALLTQNPPHRNPMPPQALLRRLPRAGALVRQRAAEAALDHTPASGRRSRLAFVMASLVVIRHNLLGPAWKQLRWSTLTRHWRHPREQDLAFWLDEVGLRRNIREQRAAGIELALPLRIMPAPQAAIYLSDPAAQGAQDPAQFAATRNMARLLTQSTPQARIAVGPILLRSLPDLRAARSRHDAAHTIQTLRQRLPALVQQARAKLAPVLTRARWQALAGRLTRDWRQASEQGLRYWLDEVGLRRNMREQRALAVDMVLPLKFLPAPWAALYLTDASVQQSGGGQTWPGLVPQRDVTRLLMQSRPRPNLISARALARSLPRADAKIRWRNMQDAQEQSLLQRSRIIRDRARSLMTVENAQKGAAGLTRRWRQPQEQALPFWLDEVGLRRNTKEQTRLATEIALPLRFFSTTSLVNGQFQGRQSVEQLQEASLFAADTRQLARVIAPSGHITFQARTSLSRFALSGLGLGQRGTSTAGRRGPGVPMSPRLRVRAARRRWRNPREQALKHWVREVARKQRISTSRQVATAIVTVLKHRPDNSINQSAYSARLVSRLRPEIATTFDLRRNMLPVSRFQSLGYRLRHILRPRKDDQTGKVDPKRFFDKILKTLATVEDVAPALPALATPAMHADFLVPHYSTLRSHLRSAPEHSALICTAFIAKAVNSRDIDELNRIFVIAPELALLPAFTRALARLGEPGSGVTLSEPEQLVVDIFLHSIGMRLTPLDIEDDWGFENDGSVSLLQAVTVPHPSQHGPALPDPDRITRWVISGRVPLCLFGHAPKDQTPDISIAGISSLTLAKPAQLARVTERAVPFKPKPMSTQRVALYSATEERLSQLTERLAKRLIDSLRDIIGPHEAQAWLEAVELPLDDLLFAATIDFWSVLHNVKTQPRHHDALVAGTPEMARAYLAGLRAFEVDHPVTLIAPPVTMSWHPNTGTMARELLADSFDLAQDNVTDQLRAAMLDSLAVSEDTAPDQGVTSLLIGRNFDRNYRTDLTELGRELQKRNRVCFMPTAGQRNKNQVLSFFDTVMSDWHNDVLYTPAFELWSPVPRGDKSLRDVILPTLIRDAAARAPFQLEDVALLLCATRQLTIFLGDRLYKFLRSGALTSQTLATLAPSEIVLMPGRDYIARVAALAGRTTGISSYDVQTVFLGPRSRYKPSVADIQFTIETQSKELFETYFGLSPKRTVLTGCAKVGLVQQEARALDRDAVRGLVDMQQKRLLVFACSPFLEEDRLIIESIAAGLKAMPQARLGIRLHPTAKPGYPEYLAELTARNPAIFELNQLDLPQTLIAADILITRFSNVGLEAALLGTDVIACNFNDAVIPVRLDQMGVSTVALTGAELQACMQDFAEQGPLWQQLQKSRAAYIAQNPQLFSASAAANMAKVITRRRMAGALT